MRDRCFWKTPSHLIVHWCAILPILLGIGTNPFRALGELRCYDKTPGAPTWQSFYNQLPSAWKTNKVVVVEEVSHNQMAHIYKETFGQVPSNIQSIDGCYQIGGERIDADATIYILNTLQGEKALEVFAHEYGHFLWDQVLNSSQREAYRSLWAAQKRRHSLATRYAATSPEEGFAEAFAIYCCHEKQLTQKDASEANFLTTLAQAAPNNKALAEAADSNPK